MDHIDTFRKIEPLDNLPADRIANALALRNFIVGSVSAQAAQDLAAAGMLKVRRYSWLDVDLIRVAEVLR